MLFGSGPAWATRPHISSRYLIRQSKLMEYDCYAMQLHDEFIYNINCTHVYPKTATVCYRKKGAEQPENLFVPRASPAIQKNILRESGATVHIRQGDATSMCPSGLFEFTILQNRMNWYSAVRACNQIGSDLIDFRNWLISSLSVNWTYLSTAIIIF